MSEARGLRRNLLLALAVAIAYYLAARLGFVLRLPPATTSVLWPPNALLTAILLLTAPRRWWIVLTAAFPAHLLVEAQAGFPASLVLALFVTNCSEALLAAALTRRWSDDAARFDSPRRVTSFLAAAVVVAPALSSFADAAVVHWLRGEDYWTVFRLRAYSNALSALTIVPSVVTIVSDAVRWLRESTPVRRLEAALLAGLISAGSMIVFYSHRPEGAGLPGVPYTSLPFLVPAILWAAVRFGAGGAGLALLATTLGVIRAATLGWRPFSPLTPGESVVVLQVFATVIGVPLLYLGAAIEGRRRGTRVLGERLKFEELVSRLSAAFVRPASHEMDRAFEDGLQQLGQFVGVDRVTLRRFTADGQLNVAYAWLAPHAAPAPGPLHRSEFPWAADRLWNKEPIVVADVEDLPDSAASERSHLRRTGVRSLLAIPLVAGEEVIGSLGFMATSAPRAWPRAVVEQCRLVADILAGAMARQQAEDDLRRSEATKAAVLASLASSVAVLDRSGRIVTVNENWARVAREGAGSGEGLGSVGSDHLAMWARLGTRGFAEAVALHAGIESVLAGARTCFVQEYPCPAHPGSWYVMTVVPLQAPEGGAVVSLTDVSERRHAEIEAQKSRQELAHFLRVSTLGELTTSLAHELNQPLAAILANAQAASYFIDESHTHDPAQVQEMLADIASEGVRAGEIIRRLRDLLRKGESLHAALDVNALVREVVSLLASDAVIRGVSLRFDARPSHLMVRGDRVQLQQVLLNVVINAMEAMATNRDQEAVVVLRTETIGEGLAGVSIEDTGPGLQTAAPGDVFEPFYTTKSQGLGMGLSIARSIVVAHGGSIAARNNPDRGATFTILLPAATGEKTHSAAEASNGEAALPATGRP
jgi:signal transduction histidine kinase/integral membrane sensor domain MASE1/GAF domain-containing protein